MPGRVSLGEEMIHSMATLSFFFPLSCGQSYVINFPATVLLFALKKKIIKSMHIIIYIAALQNRK